MGSYRIPKQRCRVEIHVSNSRFIATVAPVFSVREAQAFLREIRAEMPDASHHVYAFRVGYGNSISEGMSDDGEPSGTAGPPAMAVVRGADIGDVALVITRYFGGTKLGTGGLVAAYTKTAQAAFESLKTEDKVTRVRCEVRVPYALLERIRRTLTEHEGDIEHEAFEAEVHIRFQIPDERFAALTQAIHDLTAGSVTPAHLADD
ncbi:MAG: YigZ family protein [Planctomycetota bacterium]